MKKPFTALSATIIIGVTAFSSIPTYADTITPVQSKIIENQKEQAKINQQIERLEQAIKENQKTLADTEEKIKVAQVKLEELKAEKEKVIEQMEKREEQIKNRLRVMQAGGGTIGYIQVILGSADFEDFISRVSAISTLTKADQDLISEQKEDAKAIEENEKTTQSELTNLNDMKVELDGMQSQIAEQKSQAESMKAKLATEGRQLLEEQARQEREAAQAISAAQASVASSSSSVANPVNSRDTSSKGQANVSQSVAAPSVSGGNAISVVTSVGRQFIGNSAYSFGAQNPSSGLFDCSGFVNWAFAQAGISVGRSTSVLSGQGTKVSTSEMRPGDLVFFDTYKKNGHVGIYLGGGRFIGSQDSTGVAVANMSSGYWADAFKGHVRRVIN